MKCTNTREMDNNNVFRQHVCPACGCKIKTMEQAVELDAYEKIREFGPLEIEAIKQELMEAVAQTLEKYSPPKQVKIVWSK